MFVFISGYCGDGTRTENSSRLPEKTFRKVLFPFLLVLGIYLLVVKLSHYVNYIG